MKHFSFVNGKLLFCYVKMESLGSWINLWTAIRLRKLFSGCFWQFKNSQINSLILLSSKAPKLSHIFSAQIMLFQWTEFGWTKVLLQKATNLEAFLLYNAFNNILVFPIFRVFPKYNPKRKRNHLISRKPSKKKMRATQKLQKW